MPADLETTAPSPERPQARAQPRRSMRTHKSSCIMIEHDSQSEQVVQPGTNAPRLAPSLQAPGAFAEDPDEAGGATTVEPGAPAPLVDPDGTQSTFTTKIADTGAPDPRTVSEAMRYPNWPPREEPIEEKPDAHKAHPVVQGFSQMSGVDTHAKVACVAANLGHAHWEAVERTLHHLSGTPDPPSTHVEASSPSEGHANANPDGNMAKYRRAILGNVSLTDSGAGPGPWSGKTSPPPSPSPLRVITSQQCTASRRHHGFAAPPQTSPPTSRVPPHQFRTSQPSSRSRVTCLIARSSTHSTGPHWQCGQTPPSHTRTAARPWTGAPYWGTRSPSMAHSRGFHGPHHSSPQQSSRRRAHEGLALSNGGTFRCRLWLTNSGALQLRVWGVGRVMHLSDGRTALSCARRCWAHLAHRAPQCLAPERLLGREFHSPIWQWRVVRRWAQIMWP